MAVIVDPVIKPASSLAKKVTVLEISSTVPSLPTGILVIKLFKKSSDASAKISVSI